VISDDSIIHEVDYPADPARVWRAIVDPQELAEWLMPNDFDPTVGRLFTMNCDPFGTISGEVLAVDPPRRLECRWAGWFGQSIVTFTLTPTPAGTRLRVEHRGWTDENTADRQQFASGWPAKATALGRWLESTQV
jgi:uncharacterized protein YndB with AHSA1/START domain